MNCSECRERLVPYLEGLLDGQEKKDFELHLKDCPECQALVKEYSLLQGRLKKDAASLESQRLETGVMEMVRQKGPSKSRGPNLFKRVLKTRKRWLAAAAVLAVGVLLVGLLAPGLQRAREARRRATCINNVKQFGLASYMYGGDSSGFVPVHWMAHGGTVPPNAEAFDAMFFENYGVNPFVDTEDDHLSTFGIDVDTGSYTMARSYIQQGHLPPKDAVRVEEFINYFDYRYPFPEESNFGINMEGAASKFGQNCRMLMIGIKGRDILAEARKDAVLTFVIDVSGSMAREDRLGLVKKSLRLLIDQLTERDKIGIAIYGSRGEVLMSHRSLSEKEKILRAIDSLRAQGSTYAEEGIRKGYEMADGAYQEGCINRVILCSDGVANVGRTGGEQIFKEIKKYAEKGITLSAIGFGMGNYNDVLMEKLGDKGNGHYAYVDTIAEARRIFVENLTGTLQVLGRDVKIQVDFNPDTVRSYRLLGYENRDIKDEEFRDDEAAKEEAGEIGTGHSVTALYELKLWPEKTGRVAMVSVRYKTADGEEVVEIKSDFDSGDFGKTFEDTSTRFKLAVAVAEFSEILRKSYWARGSDLAEVRDLVQDVLRERKDDADVIELLDLVSKADKLQESSEEEGSEGPPPVE